MAIFDASKKPGWFLEGKEFPGRPTGDDSGILFYNAEGDECGGLMFGSRQMPDGTPFQALLLTFDAFRQDQVLALRAADHDGVRDVTIDMLSRPRHSLVKDVQMLEAVDAMPEGVERDAARERANEDLAAAGHAHRLRIGMSQDGSVAIQLNDSKGQSRIRISVDEKDNPRIEFLDGDGHVVYSLPPAP